MTKRRQYSGYLLWAVLLSAIAIATIAAAARLASESSPVGHQPTETERLLTDLPNRVERLLQEARERFARAKVEFRAARSESERALISQLQEAKERGSLPPL